MTRVSSSLAVVAVAALLGSVSYGTIAVAQEAAASGAATLGAATGPNPQFGLPVGDWILYPSFFAGAVFNDNIYSTSTNRVSGLGVRLRPTFEADRDVGLHKTSVYANADVQIYPGHGQAYRTYPSFAVLSNPTNITARVGFSHVYTPLPDLTFTLQGDFTRAQGGLFGGGFGAGSPMSSIVNSAALTNNSAYSNQVTGRLSVEKKFTERAFVQTTAGIQYIAYDSIPNSWWANLASGGAYGSFGSLSRGTDYSIAVRAGYWVTPQVYVFIEPGGDLRRYPNSINDTNGYRIVAGLGSDLISLFRGEVYAGYQRQEGVNAAIAASSPAFGGRISYYPTERLTISAQVDQTFSAPAAQPILLAGLPVGFAATAPSRTTQVRAQADYAILPYWTTYLRGGWGESHTSGVYNYIGRTQPGKTTSWSAGWGTSYTFWRNVAVTLEYQFSKSIPNNSGYSTWWVPTAVTQNMISAGLTYRY